jgi:hypothetical protein
MRYALHKIPYYRAPFVSLLSTLFYTLPFVRYRHGSHQLVWLSVSLLRI